MVIKTSTQHKNNIAKYGDIYTGSSLKKKQQIFVDLGCNTYIPLNDIETGNTLLQTHGLQLLSKKNE